MPSQRFALRACLRRVLQQAQEGRVQRVVEAGQGGVAAVDGQDILQQVVAADAEEVGRSRQQVDGERRRRRLDHNAQLDAPGVAHAAPAQLGGGLGQQPAHQRHFGDAW